jgi:hypothetical protein
MRGKRTTNTGSTSAALKQRVWEKQYEACLQVSKASVSRVEEHRDKKYCGGNKSRQLSYFCRGIKYSVFIR